MPRCRVRPGFVPPPRQQAVRLSSAQRAALEDALTTAHQLARRHVQRVVQTIEDGLHKYWIVQKNDAAIRRARLPQRWRKQARQLVARSRQLRNGLPFDHMHIDRELTLMKLLEQHEARWLAVSERITDRGRPADAELSWFALAVVTVLDQVGVPLNVGRTTAVVEVLHLVRKWAHRKKAQTPRPKSIDYEFTRVIVGCYRKNPR